MRFIPGTSFLVSELLPHFDSAARTLGRVPSYRNPTKCVGFRARRWATAFALPSPLISGLLGRDRIRAGRVRERLYRSAPPWNPPTTRRCISAPCGGQNQPPDFRFRNQHAPPELYPH